MDTAAINYRVADFLKDYLPFQVMDVEDLRHFALLGRVRFFEPNQFIVTQGAPRFEVFVIQQGTILLWDERSSEARLLDVRGAGAMLGIDEFDRLRSYPYTARSSSDVLIYSFPADEFETLIGKYPDALQYISAYGRVSTDERAQNQHDPQNASLRSLGLATQPPPCNPEISIRAAAQLLLNANAEMLLIPDSDKGTSTLLTASSFVEWAANGGGDPDQPARTVFRKAPLTMRADATVVEGVLATAAINAPGFTITSDGTPQGRVQSIVTARDLESIFGDRPLEILHDIRRATTVDALRKARERSRSFVLRYLTNGSASEWLSAYTAQVDQNIVRRIIVMETPEDPSACWCFSGAAGRAESLTSLAPGIVVLLKEDCNDSAWLDTLRRVQNRVEGCGFFSDKAFDVSFNAAHISVWKRRFLDWISDPIFKEIYLGRPFFDLRPVAGDDRLWRELEIQVMGAVDRDFLQIAANDCLGKLPPLTFFQNAVVDDAGEETSLFRLEETALQPLVDVARVFGIAAKKVFGTSTLERFALAAQLLPENAGIFQEAADTFRIVLWQQGRAGIAQGSSGAELSPALLKPYDRQVLRQAFQSISRLLEFIDDLEWLNRL